MSEHNIPNEAMSLKALLEQLGELVPDMARAPRAVAPNTDEAESAANETGDAVRSTPSMVLIEDQHLLQSMDDTPWFIKGMYGFGAWLSTLTTCLFLSLFGIYNSYISMILLGGAALAASISFMRKPTDSIFAHQTMLALGLVGQILLISGLAWGMGKGLSKEGWYLLALVVELGVLFANKDRTSRFFSVLGASAAFFLLLQSVPFGLQAAAGLWALGCAVLWLPGLLGRSSIPWSDRDIIPVRYGLAISLLGLLGLSSAPKLSVSFQINTWAPAALLLVGILGRVGYHLMSTYKTSWTTENKIIACVLGALSLSAFNAPGVLAAGLFFVLATEKRERLLQWLSIACFVWYISALYYNLSISLLLKSVALLIPGIGLLLLRYFYLRQPAQQPTSNEAEASHAH